MRREPHWQRPAAAELGDDAIVDCLVERERSVELEHGHGGGGALRLHVVGGEMQAMVLRRLYVGVGVEIDRGIEHAAAELIAERRQIGAASSQTKPERCTCADDQCAVLCPRNRRCIILHFPRLDQAPIC